MAKEKTIEFTEWEVKQLSPIVKQLGGKNIGEIEALVRLSGDLESGKVRKDDMLVAFEKVKGQIQYPAVEESIALIKKLESL